MTSRPRPSGRAETSRGRSFRRTVAAISLAAATAACGDGREPYAFPTGARVALDVTVREELETAGSRQVELFLDGYAHDSGAVNLRVRRMRHERVQEDGSRTLRTVDTQDAVPDPSQLTAGDRSVSRILRAGLVKDVAARFDPRDGLVALDGVGALFDPAAAPEGDEETAAGLLPLLRDDSLAKSLRAAGLCEVPEQVPRRAGTLERRVALTLPGVGDVTRVLFGEVGRETEGSPVARLTARLRATDVTAPETGPAPPAEVGPVRLPEVEIAAETLYDPESLRPLRGNVAVVLPFARGPVLRRRTSFRLVVSGP